MKIGNNKPANWKPSGTKRPLKRPYLNRFAISHSLRSMMLRDHFPLFRPRFSVFTLPREGCLLAIFLGYREWESRLRYRRIFLIDIKWKGNETGHIRNGTGYKGEKKETRRELKEIISMSLITVIKMIHVIFKLASLVYLQHTYFNIFLIKWSLSVRVLATLWNVKINIVIWNIN